MDTKLKTLKSLAAMVLAAIFLAVPALAADGVLTGKVIDRVSGQPVVDAWVGVIGTNLGTATDSLGNFRITGVPVGNHEISVSHPNFTSMAGQTGLTVEIKGGKTTQVTIALDRGMDRDTRLNAVGIPVIGDKEDLRQNHPGSAAEQGISKVMERSDVDGQYGAQRTGPSNNGMYYKLKPVPEPYPQMPQPTDMFFRDYGTNDFVSTARDRFSTFALDVDDASYNVAAQYIKDGHLPPADAIRVEEFINHFEYGYAPPEDSKFRIFTELVDSPFDNDITYLKIGIKGREIDRRRRLPLNLTVVVDVSGSMGQENRIALVKQALQQLVSQLNRNDRIGIIAYGSNAYMVLEPTDGSRQRQINAAINSLCVGGSTYAEAGLRYGYKMARAQYVNGHNNLIILCSDGVANVGRTNADDIMRSVRGWASEGITLSTFGFGMGNYNDVLLEELSQKGNGRYAYINSYDEVQRQFVDKFMGNVELLARDAKVQVEFDPKVVESYRLIGYENRAVADHRFRDNNQDGGEIGSGHEVTALYAINLRKKSSGHGVGTVFVRWTDTDGAEVSEVAQPVSMKHMIRSFEQARPELRLAVVAAQFGELLKGTEYAEADFRHLAGMSEKIDRQMHTAETGELVELIHRVQQMDVYFSDWIPKRGRGDCDPNYRR